MSWHLQLSMWPAELEYWPLWRALVRRGGKQFLWLSHQSCSVVAFAVSELSEDMWGLRHEKGRTGRAAVLPQPPLSALVPWSRVGRRCGTLIVRETLGFVLLLQSQLGQQVIFQVLLLFMGGEGVWSCTPAFPFWEGFLNGMLFLYQAHPFFWWLQEVKCSFHLKV